MDYSFDVLVSWSRDLSLYNQNYSYSVLYRISCFMMIMLYLFIPAIPVYTLVLTLARHLAFASPLAWGVSSDSPGSSCPGPGTWNMSEFGAYGTPVADQSGTAVAWISSRPFRAPSFRAPCVPLEFSFCKLVSALFTVYSCTSLVFSQLRHSGDVILL